MPSYITYSVSEDITVGKVTHRDLEKELQQSEALPNDLFAFAETKYGGDPDSIRLVLSRDPTQSELDEISSIVQNHKGLPVDNTRHVLIDNPQTPDGKLVVSLWPTEGSRKTIVSHNWADPTTWCPNSIYVSNETPSEITPGLVYKLVNTSIIDVKHGKVWEEDQKWATHKLVLETSSDGGSSWTTKLEEDPHEAEVSGGPHGDYVVDYTSGVITLYNPLTPGFLIRVSYYYTDLSNPNASQYVIAPKPGKAIKLRRAEVQFTRDIEITDTVTFQTVGYVDHFAPHLLNTAIPPGPFPSGTKIPISYTTYKSMRDFCNEANGAMPTYPALGGSGWRGMSQDVIVFQWDYAAVLTISSAAGMEVRIYLENNVPFGGTYATATVYGLIEDE